MIDFRQLRYFVAVAEELDFTRAAKWLDITQPALSQQTQALERSIGVRLFHRTQRRVQLTEAGQELLRNARRILAEVDQAVQATRKVGMGVSGRFGMAAISSAAVNIIPALLREYRAKHSKVELVFREMTSPVQLNAA